MPGTESRESGGSSNRSSGSSSSSSSDSSSENEASPALGVQHYSSSTTSIPAAAATSANAPTSSLQQPQSIIKKHHRRHRQNTIEANAIYNTRRQPNQSLLAYSHKLMSATRTKRNNLREARRQLRFILENTAKSLWKGPVPAYLLSSDDDDNEEEEEDEGEGGGEVGQEEGGETKETMKREKGKRKTRRKRRKDDDLFQGREVEVEMDSENDDVDEEGVKPRKEKTTAASSTKYGRGWFLEEEEDIDFYTLGSGRMGLTSIFGTMPVREIDKLVGWATHLTNHHGNGSGGHDNSGGNYETVGATCHHDKPAMNQGSGASIPLHNDFSSNTGKKGNDDESGMCSSKLDGIFQGPLSSSDSTLPQLQQQSTNTIVSRRQQQWSKNPLLLHLPNTPLPPSYLCFLSKCATDKIESTCQYIKKKRPLLCHPDEHYLEKRMVLVDSDVTLSDDCDDDEEDNEDNDTNKRGKRQEKEEGVVHQQNETNTTKSKKRKWEHDSEDSTHKQFQSFKLTKHVPRREKTTKDKQPKEQGGGDDGMTTTTTTTGRRKKQLTPHEKNEIQSLQHLHRSFNTTALVALGMAVEEVFTASLLPLARAHVERCRHFERVYHETRRRRNESRKSIVVDKDERNVQHDPCGRIDKSCANQINFNVQNGRDSTIAIENGEKTTDPIQKTFNEEASLSKPDLSADISSTLHGTKPNVCRERKGKSTNDEDDDPYYEWTLPPAEAVMKLMKKQSMASGSSHDNKYRNVVVSTKCFLPSTLPSAMISSSMPSCSYSSNVTKSMMEKITKRQSSKSNSVEEKKKKINESTLRWCKKQSVDTSFVRNNMDVYSLFLPCPPPERIEQTQTRTTNESPLNAAREMDRSTRLKKKTARIDS